MQNTKLSVSNTLIILSCIATIWAMIDPSIYQYGMNRTFYDQGQYGIWIAQMFTSEFLHGGMLHLLMNSVFIYYFGNILEKIIGHKMMLVFFLTYCIFQGLILTFSDAGNTIGISGFAMALLTYYTLLLYKLGNPEYKGGITALVLNVAIGLVPGISFIGHASGVIYGVIFFVLTSPGVRKTYGYNGNNQA